MQAPKMKLVTVVIKNTGLKERGLVRRRRRKSAIAHTRRTGGPRFILIVSIRRQQAVGRRIVLHAHAGKPPAEIAISAGWALADHERITGPIADVIDSSRVDVAAPRAYPSEDIAVLVAIHVDSFAQDIVHRHRL